MRQTLRPGAELELLTSSELQHALDAAVLRLAARPATVRAEDDAVTNAAGFVELEVYRVPQGMGFHLTRLLVLADGFTAAVPFNGAGAFLEVLRNDVAVDLVSLVAANPAGGSLPFKSDAHSEGAAPYYTNGDAVGVRITAGPVTTRVLVRLQGLLEPVVLGN